MAKRAAILSKSDYENFGSLLERLHKAGVPIKDIVCNADDGLKARTGKIEDDEISPLAEWRAKNGKN